MKKLLLTSILLTAVTVIYLTNSKATSQQSAEVISEQQLPGRESSQEPTPSLQPVADSGPLTAEEIELTLDEVVSVDELENSYSHLSDAEIENEIAKNQQYLDQSGLLNQANSKGLDETSTKVLIMHMRVNAALNKILISRALEKMQNKYL